MNENLMIHKIIFASVLSIIFIPVIVYMCAKIQEATEKIMEYERSEEYQKDLKDSK